jgi:glycosyltransferase involved in cell wall biosynthesis
MSVVIATIVKNEADRFLPKALECWTAVADRIVVVDNDSTDDTGGLLLLAGVEYYLLDTPMDGHEHMARSFLW